jgi:hypothetical protein
MPANSVRGGASLANAERLNDEPLARQLARVPCFTDQTQLGEWLRKQNDTSIAALWQSISEFVQWTVAQADAARWTHAGRPSRRSLRDGSSGSCGRSGGFAAPRCRGP